MAGVYLEDLTAITAPDEADLLYIVDDPAGTPVGRRVTLENIRKLLDSESLIFGTGSDWDINFDGTNLLLTGVGAFQFQQAQTLSTVSGDFDIDGAANVVLRRNGSVRLQGRAADVRILPDGSATLTFAATIVTFPADYTLASNASIRFTPTAGNGGGVNIKKATELLSGLTGASVTSTGLIPANALLLAMIVRVTTLITGATSFSIGDGTDVDRWGATIAVDAGTTTTQANYTAANAVGVSALAATDIVLTANGANFTAGAVRVTVYYVDAAALTN